MYQPIAETIDQEFRRRGLLVLTKLKKNKSLQLLQEPCREVLTSLGIADANASRDKVKVLIKIIQDPVNPTDLDLGLPRVKNIPSPHDKSPQWGIVSPDNLRQKLTNLENTLRSIP